MPSTTPITPTLASHHRFHLLDGLRGVAAVCVVLWHAGSLMHLEVASAYLGVDFFFCLSGFVVAFSYERRLMETMRLRDFFVARIIRLYPLYLFATLCSLFMLLSFQNVIMFQHSARLVAPAFVRALGMVPMLALTQKKLMFPMDFPAWSLLWEMLGSLAFGFLVSRRIVSTLALAAVAMATFMGLAVWIHGGHGIDHGSLGNKAGLTIGAVRFVLSFSLGVLMLRIYRARQDAPRAGWIPTTLITGMLIVALAAPMHFMRSDGFHLLTIALLFPLTVYLGARIKPPSASIAACLLLGEASYPLYLLHPIALQFANSTSGQRFLAAHSAHARPFLLTALAVLTALCYAITRWLDEPLRRRLAHTYKNITTSRIVIASSAAVSTPTT